MGALAAATWGIDGASFLLLWAMMAIAVFMLGTRLRDQIIGEKDTSGSPPVCDSEELAALREEPPEDPAGRALRASLERAGLLLSRRDARLVRATGLFEVPAIALGGARIAGAVHDHGAVGGLVVLVAALVLATLWFSRPRRLTRAGERAVAASAEG